LVPVKASIFFVQGARHGGARIILLPQGSAVSKPCRYCFDEQTCAQLSQTIGQRAGSLIWRDGRGARRDDVSSIEPFIHRHNGDAGFLVTCANGGCNGRRASPARQQRGVNVETSARGKLKYCSWKDLTEGRDDDQVWRELFKLVLRIWTP
jgi:hypothetical protein